MKNTIISWLAVGIITIGSFALGYNICKIHDNKIINELSERLNYMDATCVAYYVTYFNGERKIILFDILVNDLRDNKIKSVDYSGLLVNVE
jgi:hypothetical protein